MERSGRGSHHVRFDSVEARDRRIAAVDTKKETPAPETRVESSQARAQVQAAKQNVLGRVAPDTLPAGDETATSPRRVQSPRRVPSLSRPAGPSRVKVSELVARYDSLKPEAGPKPQVPITVEVATMATASEEELEPQVRILIEVETIETVEIVSLDHEIEQARVETPKNTSNKTDSGEKRHQRSVTDTAGASSIGAKLSQKGRDIRAALGNVRPRSNEKWQRRTVNLGTHSQTGAGPSLGKARDRAEIDLMSFLGELKPSALTSRTAPTRPHAPEKQGEGTEMALTDFLAEPSETSAQTSSKKK